MELPGLAPVDDTVSRVPDIESEQGAADGAKGGEDVDIRDAIHRCGLPPRHWGEQCTYTYAP